MDVMDYLKENLRPMSPLLGYAIAGVVAAVRSHWAWVGLGFITIFSPGVQGFQFGFSRWGNHAQGRVMLQSFSSSCASNHGVTRKNSTAFADDNLRIGSNMFMDDIHLFTYKGDSLNEEGIYRTKGSSTIDSLTSCNSGEATDAGGARRKLGPSWFDNYCTVDLGLGRRLESFEIQFGLDRLHSLRLGYDWNWNCYTGTFGLNLNKFSKYSVRDIQFTKVLGSPKGSLVKLHSLQENAVSSFDMVWNSIQGLSCTSTIDNPVRLWDIEVGKCLSIENSPGFLLSGITIREHENAPLFVWYSRDFLKPLDFSVGNMVTFHNVHVKDKKVFVSDCFSLI